MLKIIVKIGAKIVAKVVVKVVIKVFIKVVAKKLQMPFLVQFKMSKKDFMVMIFGVYFVPS